MTGLRFGRWTVVNYAGPDKFKNATWNCVCDCGNKGVVIGAHMRCGSSQSCGCYNIDRTKEAHTTLDSYFKRVYRTAKNASAKPRGLAFELSEEKYYELIRKNCYYCNREPYEIRFSARHSKGVFPCHGVDRVDNSKGYTVENSVPCCSGCNIAKMDYSEAEFLETVRLIYENRILKR